MMIESNVAMSVLATKIISTYFTQFYCILILNENRYQFTYKGHLPVVNYNFKHVTELAEAKMTAHKCEGIVIFSSDPKTVFRKVEHEIKLAVNVRYNFRKYLILLPDNFSEMKLHDLFNTTELMYVPNFLVVNKIHARIFECAKFELNCKQEIEFNLFTNKFVGKNNQLDKVFLDKWFSINENYLDNNELYPDKVHNQEGRILRLATFDYRPFHITLESGDSVGTETNILLEYAKKRNMSFTYVIDEKGEWGDVNENWTGTGIIGNIAMDNADIGYDALYLNWDTIHSYVDFSQKNSRSEVPLLVPEPILLGGWSVPFYPFSTAMWIATAISFITCCLTFFLIALYVREKSCQKGYSKTIETVEDLANSDLFWGGTSIAWTFAIENAQEEKYKKSLKRFISASPDELEKLSHTRNFGFTIERFPSGYFSIPTYIKADAARHFRLTKEDLYWAYCIFMLRKSSVLLPSLDEFILRISEAGIDSALTTSVILKYTNSRVQEIVRYYTSRGESKEITSLKLMHVQGTFGILIIGLIIGLFIFLVELVTHKLQRPKFCHINFRANNL